jgi:hypothetical protein
LPQLGFFRECVRTVTPVLAETTFARDSAGSDGEGEETDPAVLETIRRRDPGYWWWRREKCSYGNVRKVM